VKPQINTDEIPENDAAHCRAISQHGKVVPQAAGSLLYITTNAIRHYHSTAIYLIFRVSELMATSIIQ